MHLNETHSLLSPGVHLNNHNLTASHLRHVEDTEPCSISASEMVCLLLMGDNTKCELFFPLKHSPELLNRYQAYVV